MWCHISGGAGAEIWLWSLSGVKGLMRHYHSLFWLPYFMYVVHNFDFRTSCMPHMLASTPPIFLGRCFVLAKTDPEAPAGKAFTGFVVDRDTPGITPGRKVSSYMKYAKIPMSNLQIQDICTCPSLSLFFLAFAPLLAHSFIGLLHSLTYF